jgi:two-component system cell cycle sensor histidine kinase PleC
LGGGASKHGGYAADILASGRHLLAVINQILDLAKIEAGKMQLQVAEFPVSRLLQDCIRFMRVRAEKKSLDLTLEDDCAGVMLEGDETALRQVLLNVLSNAILYTERGAVTVVAKTIGQELLVEVKDTGRGMTEAQMAKIFVPFERVDKYLSASTGGSGLGLSIVKKLVEMHHGTCWVISEPKKGTTFFLRLPLANPAAVPTILAA